MEDIDIEVTRQELPSLAPVAERVAAGIAWLDEQAAAGTGVPADWRRIVDRGRLRMQSGEDCVIGQIGDHVTDGDRFWGWARETYPDVLGWTTAETVAEALGFNISLDRAFGETGRADAWHELTEAWKAALAPVETADDDAEARG